MNHLIRPITLISACLLLLPAWVAAQNKPSEPMVRVTGTVKVVRQPELVRLQMQLSAQDKEAKNALAKIKDLQIAAKTKLVGLGFDEKSITFETPVISQGLSPEMQQRQRMMGNRPRPQPAAQLVTVTVMLKAQMPLKADDTDAMLLAADELQSKVKAANLNGPTKPLSPEEQEAREEAQGDPNDGETQPGTPSFVFIARLPSADRAKAIADAFAKAKTEAQLLAQAAGQQLGQVTELASQSNGRGAEESMDPYAYRRYMYMNGNQDPATTGEEGEGLRMSPGPISFQITVEAAFTLK